MQLKFRYISCDDHLWEQNESEIKSEMITTVNTPLITHFSVFLFPLFLITSSDRHRAVKTSKEGKDSERCLVWKCLHPVQGIPLHLHLLSPLQLVKTRDLLVTSQQLHPRPFTVQRCHTQLSFHPRIGRRSSPFEDLLLPLPLMWQMGTESMVVKLRRLLRQRLRLGSFIRWWSHQPWTWLVWDLLHHHPLPPKSLLDNDLYTDVTFVVEGKRLKAHRIVLALKSDVFHNMFSSQKDETTFTITDTTFPAFQELLNYVYTNKCNAVSVDTTIRLLGLAEQYHFKELKKACLNHVMKKLSPDTAVEALIVGNTYGIDKVKSAALKVIKRNKVSELKNWDKLRGHDTLKDQVCVYLQGYNNWSSLRKGFVHFQWFSIMMKTYT